MVAVVHTMLMLLYRMEIVSDGSRERKIDLQLNIL